MTTSIVLPFVYKISYTKEIEEKQIDTIISDLKSSSHIVPAPGENNIYSKIYSDYKELLQGAYIYDGNFSNFEKYHLVSITERIKHQLRRIYKDCEITTGATPIRINSEIDKVDYMQLFLRVLTSDFKNLIVLPENITSIMNGFIYKNIFENQPLNYIPLLDTPMSPRMIQHTKLFPIFNCKTYSIDTPRTFHIPLQYVRLMISILIKALQKTITNEELSNDMNLNIYRFVASFPSIRFLLKYNITRGSVQQTLENTTFIIDESDLLFADFITEYEKDSTVSENDLSPSKYVDFQSKKEYCERIITSFLEQCYVSIIYDSN
jgi:hypothetical protein